MQMSALDLIYAGTFEHLHTRDANNIVVIMASSSAMVASSSTSANIKFSGTDRLTCIYSKMQICLIRIEIELIWWFRPFAGWIKFEHSVFAIDAEMREGGGGSARGVCMQLFDTHLMCNSDYQGNLAPAGNSGGLSTLYRFRLTHLGHTRTHTNSDFWLSKIMQFISFRFKCWVNWHFRRSQRPASHIGLGADVQVRAIAIYTI